MLKDHVDYTKLVADIRAASSGQGPLPTIATWRRAREGEVCAGCGHRYTAGALLVEDLTDGSVGHMSCHTPGGGGITVTGGRRRRAH